MKMLLSVVLFTFSILSSPAQSVTLTDTIIFQKFPDEKAISFEPVFSIQNDFIRRIFLIDTSIVLWSLNADKGFYFRNYSMTGKLSSPGYIKAGTGFGKVTGALSGGYYKGNYWLHDVAMKKLVTATPSTDAADADTLLLQEYAIKDFYFSTALIDNQQLLASGSYDVKYRLVKINLQNGLSFRKYGTYSNPPDNVPENSWKQSYESFVFTNPGGTKAALACRYTDQVEFIDLATQHCSIVKGPENYPVAFNTINTNGKDIMERTTETRFAFVSGTASDKYIYLLYSGNQEVDGAGNLNGTGKIIYVYDWEGHPVRKYTTSNFISSIAVSSDDSLLYAYDTDTKNIVKTKISN
jgi:TolB-like 6-blade propeller-like